MRKQLGYSEFSFGYAFTENLVRSSVSGPASAPEFPNLVDEGSCGYDVKIDRGGAPLFLQYKLPERMVRASAAEIAYHGLHQYGLQVPFLRMYLMRRHASRQHELLVDLEQEHPGRVFYATPCMRDERMFNRAYVAVAVHEESALFSPIDIGKLPDGAMHRVAYNADRSGAWFCSEPRQIRAFGVRSVIEELGGSIDKAVDGDVASVARALQRSIVSRQPRELEEVEAAARGRVAARRGATAERPWSAETEEAVQELLVAREVARMGLGVELLFAQRRG